MTVPDFAGVVQLIETHRLAYAAARQKKSTGKRLSRVKDSEPPRDPFRAQLALPPPHLGLTGAEVAAEEKRNAVARQRGLRRETARIPSWGYRLAARVHAGRIDRELAQVPADTARRIRAAASYAREQGNDAAQRSIVALALVAHWLSTRAPGRCGIPSTVAGLPLRHLASLTRKHNGRPYSASSLAHGTHRGKAPDGHKGPRGGTWGDPTQGEVGFLRLLELHGVLWTWTPMPHGLPEWMIGARGFPCLCWRAGERPTRPDPSDPPQGPPRRERALDPFSAALSTLIPY